MVKMWNLEISDFTASLRGHQGAVSCVDIAPDEAFVVSGSSSDRTVKIWSVIMSCIITDYRVIIICLGCTIADVKMMIKEMLSSNRHFTCSPHIFRLFASIIAKFRNIAMTGRFPWLMLIWCQSVAYITAVYLASWENSHYHFSHFLIKHCLVLFLVLRFPFWLEGFPVSGRAFSSLLFGVLVLLSVEE